MSGRALDPTGRVYLHDDAVFRVIYPEAAERVRKMFESGLVAKLAERGLLIPTELAESNGHIVLRHERCPFVVGGHEWPASLLRDAALVWVDLNLALAEHGLGTVDAHPANIAQTRDCAPVWLDFGSIAPLTDARQAVGEFERFYLNPLRLLARSSPLSPMVRALLRHNGLSNYEWECLRTATLLPVGGKLQNVCDQARRHWRRYFPAKKGSAPAARVAALQRIRSELESWTAAKSKTYWADYQGARGDEAVAWRPDDARHAEISRQLSALRPRQVIDLAGNIGRFAFHAESLGAEVLSLDFDEGAVEQLYRTARRQARGRRLACACANVMHPPYERHGILRQADAILALALTHHLALGQHFSWEAIVGAIGRYSRDALLVEYMPHGLSPSGPPKDPLPAWYRREGLLSALEADFREVSVVAEFRHASHRDLILARGKRRPA